jgi:hypothetical protein
VFPHKETPVYEILAAKADAKPGMVDCTNRPDIIEACERAGMGDPIGAWFEGRFLVYTHSLKQWRGEPVEFNV